MSLPSGLHVDGSPGTVAGLRSRAVPQPLVKESLDFLIARPGLASPKILAHQVDPGLKEIERRPERVGGRRRRVLHGRIPAERDYKAC